MSIKIFQLVINITNANNLPWKKITKNGTCNKQIILLLHNTKMQVNDLYSILTYICPSVIINSDSGKGAYLTVVGLCFALFLHIIGFVKM